MDALIVSAVVTTALAVLSLLPLIRTDYWLIRALDFPRLQLTFLALINLLVSIWLLERSELLSVILLLMNCLLLAYQAWWIVPYTPMARTESRDARQPTVDNRISILASNVLEPNRNSEALLRIVREQQPDVIVTLETSLWWENQLAVLEQEYPHTVKCAQDNLYGMHLYSRLPLQDSSVNYLLEDDIPSIHTSIRLRSGQCITAHFLHPRPPSLPESDSSSERDAELLMVGRSVADSHEPVIVAGDLNDVAWSRTTRLFRRISGLLDPRRGRGMFNTFHARYWFLRWPLDHLFHSSHFSVSRLCLLPSIGSDHFPLFAELVYEGDQQNGSSLKADQKDFEEAEQKMAEENVSADEVPEP